MRVEAPAKINAGLRVVGRRSDGRHELQSLFLPLDLADDIELEIRPGHAAPVLELSGEITGAPADTSNLAARAASAFLAAAALERAVRIRLIKRIPVAAGLGGGSSDAGAVLRVLNSAFPDALAPAALTALAAELGADVPFFLDPRPAEVEGVGERIRPVPAGELALLLANPGVPLATERVFRAYDALAAGEAPAPAPPAALLLAGRPEDADPADLARLLHNDLEPAATRLCPPIAWLRAQLAGAGALAVGMSGSGPTLFAIFESAARAQEALAGTEFPSRPSSGPLSGVWARVAATRKSG